MTSLFTFYLKVNYTFFSINAEKKSWLTPTTLHSCGLSELTIRFIKLVMNSSDTLFLQSNTNLISISSNLKLYFESLLEKHPTLSKLKSSAYSKSCGCQGWGGVGVCQSRGIIGDSHSKSTRDGVTHCLHASQLTTLFIFLLRKQ